MAFKINDNCINCCSCIDECPTGAISEGDDKVVIDAEKCIGCGKCARNCPANAITGEKKKPHVIDSNLCIRCDQCRSNCKFDAVVVE